MNETNTDGLCTHCGEAFSAFLNEMAEHNAKVTACPKCGKPHDFSVPKVAKPAAKPRSARKSLKPV